MQKQILEAIIDEPVLIKEIRLKQSIKDRLLRRKPTLKLELKASTARTAYKLSNLIIDLNLGEVSEFEIVASNMHQVAIIIATAIHNHNSNIPEGLVDVILDNFTNEELLETFKEVYRRLDTHSFFGIMELLQNMMIVSGIQETTALGQD